MKPSRSTAGFWRSLLPGHSGRGPVPQVDRRTTVAAQANNLWQWSVGPRVRPAACQAPKRLVPYA